jgi:NADH:ubiquinone oxidoreductase subunit 5 (subunit L)/multisubunit Na+/H+ antiporter MnhA subunit
MIIMVTSDNLIQFFLGWEGIGVMSYLLINFWYDRPEANRSAMKAIFLNKIGDVGFYFVICFFILFYRSVDFGVIYNLTEGRDDVSFEYSAVAWSKFDLISFFIILAAVGKSSQLALHMWLPEAMEGPTPVSALLHSATMVTAGVFLLVRMAPILESSAAAHPALVWIGILTSFISSFIACNQTDFKKIVAYSTTGQLALMFIACGFSQYGLAMQHLFNHAFFKASLFLIAGSLIHHVSSRQDVRDFGNVLSYMPFTFSMFMLSTISLIGIPATSGFVSKEYILESSFVGSGYEDIVGILVSISICLTAFYSIQLLWLAFGGYNWNSHFVIQESRSPIFYSILFLCTSGVVTGFLFQEVFNNVFIYREIIPNDAGGFRAVEMSPDLAWLLIADLPLFFVFFSGVICLYFNNFFREVTAKFYFISGPLNALFTKKFYFDFFIFYFIFSLFFRIFYTGLFKFYDRFVAEVWGPRFLVRLFSLDTLLSLKRRGIGKIFNYFRQFGYGVVLIAIGTLFMAWLSIHWFLTKVFKGIFVLFVIFLFLVDFSISRLQLKSDRLRGWGSRLWHNIKKILSRFKRRRRIQYRNAISIFPWVHIWRFLKESYYWSRVGFLAVYIFMFQVPYVLTRLFINLFWFAYLPTVFSIHVLINHIYSRFISEAFNKWLWLYSVDNRIDFISKFVSEFEYYRPLMDSLLYATVILCIMIFIGFVDHPHDFLWKRGLRRIMVFLMGRGSYYTFHLRRRLMWLSIVLVSCCLVWGWSVRFIFWLHIFPAKFVCSYVLSFFFLTFFLHFGPGVLNYFFITFMIFQTIGAFFLLYKVWLWWRVKKFFYVIWLINELILWRLIKKHFIWPHRRFVY